MVIPNLKTQRLEPKWPFIQHGPQLEVDTTLVSPLTGAAEPRRRAGRFAGAGLHAARQTKERTYPELVGSGRCRLEVGRRWSVEAAQFLRLLGQTKAQAVPQHLLQTTDAALISRCSAIHSCWHASIRILPLFKTSGWQHNRRNCSPSPCLSLLPQVDFRGDEGAIWISSI